MLGLLWVYGSQISGLIITYICIDLKITKKVAITKLGQKNKKNLQIGELIGIKLATQG